MCEPATIGLITAAVTAGTTAYSADQQRKAQHAQQDSARELLKASKPPTPPAPPRRREDTLLGGYASTLLTGPQGVRPGSQNIGSNTLLGQ